MKQVAQRRFFTVDEARTLLPQLKEWVGEFVGLSRELEKFRPVVEKLAETAAQNTGAPEGTAYLEVLLCLQKYLSKVQEAGCLVKSVQEGLVDFPHMREGREVYLCWKYGEDDIEYWHEVDAGYTDRFPLVG